MHLLRRYLNLLIAVAFGATLIVLAPLGTAFELGSCEGYELMKGTLFSLGYGPREMWNDQPPFHTFLLGVLFRAMGPSVYWARLLQVAFASLLVSCFYGVLHRQTDRVGAVAGVLLLVSTPPFLKLSAAVIIELPAMALAIASFLAWRHYVEKHRTIWLAVSACLMGVALQTKLTAVLFLPAMLTDYLLWRNRQVSFSSAAPTVSRERERNSRHGLKCLLARLPGAFRPFLCLPCSKKKPVLIWLMSLAAVFTLIALAFGESMHIFWKSHFSSGTRSAYANSGFEIAHLLQTPEALLAASVGLASILWYKRWNLLPPIVFFATVLLVHRFHRPYWDYYYLHFCIALAWLGSAGFAELFAIVGNCQSRHFKVRPVQTCFAFTVWAGLTALVIVEAPLQIKKQFDTLSKAQVIAQNAAVREMATYRGVTKWAVTDQVIYAFHAHLLVPPELAVVPEKRVTSGEIQSADILKVLRHYRPEQIALFGSLAAQEVYNQPEVLEFIKTNYVAKDTVAIRDFYLLRSLVLQKATDNL